jgi:RNA methyltransferase, TrmH family
MTDQQWQHVRRVLVLDRVQDPGNLGTLLRTAEALNWDAVYLLDGCCDVFNEKAIRAARGATFRVSLKKGTWEELRLKAEHSSMLLLAAAATKSDNSEELAMAESSQRLDRDASMQSSEALTEAASHGVHAANDFSTLAHSSQMNGASFSIGSDPSNLFEQLESRKVALVLGSEGQGLREDVLKDCRTVSVPMVGQVESLNVASAGSMLMLLLSQSLRETLQGVHEAVQEAPLK